VVSLVDNISGCRFDGGVAGDQGVVKVKVLKLLVMSDLIDKGLGIHFGIIIAIRERNR
jgi:hypothetical protein